MLWVASTCRLSSLGASPATDAARGEQIKRLRRSNNVVRDLREIGERIRPVRSVHRVVRIVRSLARCNLNRPHEASIRTDYSEHPGTTRPWEKVAFSRKERPRTHHMRSRADLLSGWRSIMGGPVPGTTREGNAASTCVPYFSGKCAWDRCVPDGSGPTLSRRANRLSSNSLECVCL